MINYKIIEADLPDELEKAVKSQLKIAGWKLQGGVSVAAVAVVKPEGEIISAWKYHQAVVKGVAK